MMTLRIISMYQQQLSNDNYLDLFWQPIIERVLVPKLIPIRLIGVTLKNSLPFFKEKTILYRFPLHGQFYVLCQFAAY